MEYHNQIWTWFDLLMAIRGDTKTVILSQVHSLGIKEACSAEHALESICVTDIGDFGEHPQALDMLNRPLVVFFFSIALGTKENCVSVVISLAITMLCVKFIIMHSTFDCFNTLQ